MRKLYAWLGLAILIVGGIVIIMVYKEDPDNTLNDTGDNIDIEEIRERVKKNNKFISKDKANNKFDPNKNIDKDMYNLEYQLTEVSENGSKAFEFVVENVSDQNQVLRFGTSQRYDYKIFNEDREEIYHYSEGKSFLQVIEEVDLAPEEKLMYEITPPDLDAGKYTISISLAAEQVGMYQKMLEFHVK